MRKPLRWLTELIALCLLGVVLITSCCTAGNQMTVEEFARLIGYANVQKISLGTFGEMLGEGRDGLAILLKVSIYRNDQIPGRDEYIAGVDPITPDETVVVGQVHLARSFVSEDEEIFLSYVLERKESIPGYTLYFGVRGNSSRYDIEVPELFAGYAWQSSWSSHPGSVLRHEMRDPVSYYSAGGWKSDYATSPSSSLWSPSTIDGAGRVANAFHVYVDFSYEIVEWSPAQVGDGSRPHLRSSGPCS